MGFTTLDATTARDPLEHNRFERAFRPRKPWILACAAFPIIAVVSHYIVFPPKNANALDWGWFSAMSAVEALIGLRLLIGLARGDRAAKAWCWLAVCAVSAAVLVICVA